MAYATEADLAALLAPDPAPANADRLLTRASRVIDAALKCAVYDVDETGNPTDADVAAALRDATCEQAAAWIETGADEGIPSGYGSVRIGSVSLSGGPRGGEAAGQGPTSPLSTRLTGQARQILDAAGLLQTGPWIW